MNQSYIEKVAAKIIEQLEQGTAPWQKPWKAGELRAPFNPTSGKDYRGFNNVWLQMQGYSDPRWMTFNQAKDEGARIRKGEKGSQIVFWQFTEERDAKDAQGNPILEDGKPKKIAVQLERPKSFTFTVFNAEQIDGLPPLEAKPVAPEAVRCERAESLLLASGAKIKHQFGDRAFYSPMIDGIVLPEREQFSSAEGYYATALHELGHWTGHPDRLNRDLDHPFGTIEYAKEELRAEIASLMMAEKLDLPHDPGQHASYVASWIKVLQDDPREIFRAAADAERISGHILDIEHSQETVQSQEQAHMDKEPILYRITTGRDDLGQFDSLAAALNAFEADGHRINSSHLLVASNGTIEDELIGHDWVGIDNSDHRYRCATPELEKYWNAIDHNTADTDALRKFEATAVLSVERRFIELGAEQTAQPPVLAENDPRFEALGPTQQAIERDWRLANGIGVVSEIQTLAAERLTARETAKRLGEKLKLVDEMSAANGEDAFIARNREQLVRSVRSKLNIPSMDEKTAFELWRSQLQVRADRTVVGGETVLHETPKDEASGRIHLAVPYAEKEEAKAAAKAAGFTLAWDKDAKAWSAPSDADLATLTKWRADGPRVVTPAPEKSPEEQFAEALRAEGLILQGAPIMDGTMHRVPVEGDRGAQTGGAYVGHLIGQVPGGYIQNFRTGAQVNWKADGAVDQLSPDERARLNAEAAQQRTARAAERQALQEQTSIAAMALWNDAPLASVENAYCKAKGIDNPEASGLRVVPQQVSKETEALGIRIAKTPQEARALRAEDAGNRVFMAGDLLVPGFDENGRLWTLQAVNPHFKSLMKDGRKHGLMTVAGAADLQSALVRDPSKPLIIAEGFATAATVSKLTGQPVIVAFDSGNLSPVCETLREQFPTRPLFIAADNDHAAEQTRDAQGRPKPNVGLEKAKSAAEKFGGGVIAPEFAGADKGSDWNDYLAEKGEQATERHFAEQMAAARADATLAAQKIASLADEHLAELQNDPPTGRDVETMAKARSENAHALVFASAQLDELYGKTAQALALERATERPPVSAIDAIGEGLDRLENGVNAERSHIASREEQFSAEQSGHNERPAAPAKPKAKPRGADLGAGY